MRPRKLTFLFIIPIVFLVGSAFAQTPALQTALNLTSEQYEALVSEVTATNPIAAEDLPIVGEFYFWQNSSLLASPGNFFALPGWDLGNGIYLLDDVHFQPQFHSGSRRMEDDGSGSTNGFSYSFDTNGLWLEMTGVSNGLSYLNLHNATNEVYAIWSTTNLMNGCSVETEVWPTNSSVMPFQVPTASRSNLFLQAEDWTSVTHGGNTTPDWWFWEYFGGTGLTLSDTNLDSQGATLLYDYEDGFDPNIIQFTLSAANNYVASTRVPLGLNVQAGWPYDVAVVVDDTNYVSDANWQPCTGTNVVADIGLTSGWHDIWVGLKGFPANASQTWQRKRVKLDQTPPVLVFTSPTTNTLDVPVLQLQGYCSKPLASLTYDLSNASGTITGQQVFIVDQFYDTNTAEFTTNAFQAYDVPLTNGINEFTFYATDLAGNVSITNLGFSLDYSSKTNPPTVTFLWPQDDMTVSGTNFVMSGWVSDPTSTIIMQWTDSDGTTNTCNAMVGRDGVFYVQNVPLLADEMTYTLVATDAAGNVATSELTVMEGESGLNVDPIATNQTTVTGEIASTNYTVWVLGVLATLNSDGTWQATNVPIPLNASLVPVTAVPNSDNGGNGTGGGPGVNPSSAESENASAPAENSGMYMSVFNGAYNYLNVNSWGNSVNRNSSYNFGDVGQSWTDSEAVVDGGRLVDDPQRFSTWPPDPWPQPEQPGTQVDVDIGVSNTFSDVPLGTRGIQAHVDTGGSQTTTTTSEADGTVVSTTTYHLTAQPKITLLTGGPPGSTMQNLWVLTAIVDNGQFTPTDFSWDDLPEDFPLSPVDYTQVTVGTFGKLDATGHAYKVLPDNVTLDITPQVSGNDNYIFNLVPIKYLSYFTVLIDMPDPPPGTDLNVGWNYGHAWWMLSNDGGSNVVSHFTTSDCAHFVNEQVGYAPNGVATPRNFPPGMLRDPETDPTISVSHQWMIGFEQLLGGLSYTLGLKTNPGFYQVGLNNCSLKARIAGFHSGVAVPFDVAPENFGWLIYISNGEKSTGSTP